MKSTLMAVTACLVSTAAVAGPSMSTKWNDTDLSLERCRRALRSAAPANFRGIKVLTYSVFAERGDIPRCCATDKTMVFFVVAGPEVERTNKYVDDIGDNF